MSTPAKILRPGSAFTGEQPMRRVSVVSPEHVVRESEFAEFATNCSVEDLKKRYQSDPIFAAWYERRGGL